MNSKRQHCTFFAAALVTMASHSGVIRTCSRCTWRWGANTTCRPTRQEPTPWLSDSDKSRRGLSV